MSLDISKILFEDNHLIIINKKSGKIVQGDKTRDIPLLEDVKNYIKVKYNKPGDVFLGLIHRLDRPVSGIVMFAKTSKALTRMNELFRDRQIIKKYWALTKNKPSETEGILTHYLIKDSAKNKSAAYGVEKKGTSKAVLDYKIIANSDSFYLLEINLHTGRHHQIRAQLAAINCTIKGDVKYGFQRANENGSINLHAVYVSFIHPVTKEKIEIKAPLPDEKTWKLFSKVKYTFY